jgi:hypothetical protein
VGSSADAAVDVSVDVASETASDALTPSDARSEAPDVSASVDSGDATASEAESDASVDASSEVGLDAAEAGPIQSKICALSCGTTDDCRGDASNSKQVCDPLSGRCVACVDDLPCIAGASAWTKSCALDGDCGTTFGDYCVDVAGFGVCAFDKSKIGTTSCFGNPGTYVVARHGDAGTVEVCAKLTTTCDLKRGRCEAPCTITCTGDGSTCTNTCTVARGGKICNATTKRCECASDADCAAPTGHCNLVTLQCECASSNDCSDGSSASICK